MRVTLRILLPQGSSLFLLVIFCDMRHSESDSPADAAAAAPRQLHEASTFSIKSIVTAAATSKSLKEINFVRLSLSASCVSSVLDAA